MQRAQCVDPDGAGVGTASFNSSVERTCAADAYIDHPALDPKARKAPLPIRDGGQIHT